MGVFRDPRDGNDQALHGDRPHGAIPTRKTAKVQRVLREWRQVGQPQDYIHLKRNNEMTHCYRTELTIKLPFPITCMHLVFTEMDLSYSVVSHHGKKQLHHLFIPDSLCVFFQQVKGSLWPGSKPEELGKCS